jgi:hypothetical protein
LPTLGKNVLTVGYCADIFHACLTAVVRNHQKEKVMNTISRICARFDTLLRRQLGANYETAVQLNKKAQGGVCHLHDFCDANEILLWAFTQTLGYEPELPSEEEDETGIPGDNDMMETAYDLWHQTTGYKSELN